MSWAPLIFFLSFFFSFNHSFFCSFFCSFSCHRFQICSAKARVSALSTLLDMSLSAMTLLVCVVMCSCPWNFLRLKTKRRPEEYSTSFWEVKVSFFICSSSLYPFKIDFKVFTRSSEDKDLERCSVGSTGSPYIEKRSCWVPGCTTSTYQFQRPSGGPWPEPWLACTDIAPMHNAVLPRQQDTDNGRKDPPGLMFCGSWLTRTMMLWCTAMAKHPSGQGRLRSEHTLRAPTSLHQLWRKRLEKSLSELQSVVRTIPRRTPTEPWPLKTSLMYSLYTPGEVSWVEVNQNQ